MVGNVYYLYVSLLQYYSERAGGLFFVEPRNGYDH